MEERISAKFSSPSFELATESDSILLFSANSVEIEFALALDRILSLKFTSMIFFVKAMVEQMLAISASDY